MKHVRLVSRLSIATLIALMALGTVASFHIPSAFAYVEPTIVQHVTVDNMNNTTGVITATFPSDVTNQDELVALVGWGGGNGWEVSNISDSLGTDLGGEQVWSSFNSPSASLSNSLPMTPYVSDGLQDSAQIFFTTDTVAGSNPETVSFDLSETGCPCGSSWLQTTITLFEISGESIGGPNVMAPLTSRNWGVENGTGGTDHLAGTNSLGMETTDLDLGIYLDGGADKTISGVTNETLVANDSPTSNIGYAIMSASANDITHAEFNTSGTAGYSVIYAVSIGPA